MQTALTHFRSLATKTEAGRIAHNAATSELLERINAKATVISQIEENDGDASKQKSDLRALKQERANLKPPSFYNPLPVLEQYARTHASAELVEPVSFDIPRGQTPAAVHNNAAEKTNAIVAEIGRVLVAPAAAEERADDIAAQIESIATPPRLRHGVLEWPRHVVNSNGTAVTMVNIEGLMAWLHGPAIVAKMMEEIDAGGPGITAADRARKLAALQTKLVDSLRLEAAAAMEAEQAGQRIERRRHVHPAILLGIKVSPATVWDWLATRKGA